MGSVQKIGVGILLAALFIGGLWFITGGIRPSLLIKPGAVVYDGNNILLSLPEKVGSDFVVDVQIQEGEVKAECMITTTEGIVLWKETEQRSSSFTKVIPSPEGPGEYVFIISVDREGKVSKASKRFTRI